MGYTNILSIIEEDKLRAFMSNMIPDEGEQPYLISETMSLLEDNSIMRNAISDSNKVALCNMLRSYFVKCYYDFMEDTKFKNLIKYGRMYIYRVAAADGLRYATNQEIKQGVSCLIGEETYPAGENEYRLLCLLQWTIDGCSYYFRQAGFQLEYTADGKVATMFYGMIQMCANKLLELFNWMHTDEYDKCIDKLKKLVKSKGYKYASYAKDEITEDIPIKQLILNIKQKFPKQSPVTKYRKALALALKGSKDISYIEPLDITFLRNTYTEFVYEQKNIDSKRQTEVVELKKLCEMLVSERYSGKINSEHFAYRIIGTLKANDYVKCSPKQMQILEDAKKKILKHTEDSENEQQNDNEQIRKTEILTEDEIDTSLAALSNAIGDGLFED